MKTFFYKRLYNYSLLITYYHRLNEVSDLVQSCTKHALLKFSNILKLFDQKKVAIATFMDLSKAFDCVGHNILLSKLKRYGIHETALQWINSYLSDREHFVSWNQTLSPLLDVNIGVPQGSILWGVLIPVIFCYSFSMLMTPQYLFNMIQLMVQFKSLTRN